jgi:molybdate transport system ATP-binding protein
MVVAAMTLHARIVVNRQSFALDVELRVEAGETVAVLGPNGAGKTTTLRALAGLVSLNAGRVTLGDRVLDDPAAGIHVAPQDRPMGVVFQDYALFEHLSALDNVAYGLRRHGLRRSDARGRARSWLERVGVDESGKRPSELSGGQRQRVALARALAYGPHVLLLDEPLAALDVSTKDELRRLLREPLGEQPVTRVLVTHDPIDALTLADRLVIVESGTVMQSGTAADIVGHPATAYVADLVGVNLLLGTGARGTVTLDDGGELAAVAVPDGPVRVVVHPRAVSISVTRPQTSARNVWPGRIEDLDQRGEVVRVRVGGPPAIVAEVTAGAVAALGLRRTMEVWVSVKATEVAVEGR